MTLIGFGLGGIVMGRLADRFGVMVVVLIGHRVPGRGFRRCGDRRQPVAVQPGARPADRHARDLGHLRAAGGRHLAMVRPAPGHCAGDLHEWQLPGRRGLAAGDAVLHRQRRLAQPPMSVSAWSAWRPWLPLALVLRSRPPRAVMPAPGASAGSAEPIGAFRRPVRPAAPARPASEPACSCCCAWPAWRAASRCRCRRCTSWPTAPTWASALRTRRRDDVADDGFGIVSRLLSGWISDHIGGLRTLMLGSVLQGVALLMFLPFDGLVAAVRGLRPVRPVPGRHRALVRADRARILHAARRPAPASGGADGHAVFFTGHWS
jgi:hypothetical protein